MEKLLDYIYDFTGIFIPGLTFWMFFWLTTVFFLPTFTIDMLFALLPDQLVLFSDLTSPLVQVIVSREAVAFSFVIVVCYVTGLLFSEKFKYSPKTNEEGADIFIENKRLVSLVDRNLRFKLNVDWEVLEPKKRWIVYYRWANMLSAHSSDRSNLQLILAKAILFRSLGGSFKVMGWIVGIMILLVVATYIYSANFTLNQLIIFGSFGIFLFFVYRWWLARFFSRTSERYRKLLQNESLLVLSKYFYEEQKAQ